MAEFTNRVQPTRDICDAVLNLAPAEGGGSVVGAEGGNGVARADGGGTVESTRGGRDVAPADFSGLSDVAPRRISFDLAFDPSTLSLFDDVDPALPGAPTSLGGTAITNPSVGRLDYDLENRVLRLDGRVVGVFGQDRFAEWCARLNADEDANDTNAPG